MKILVLNCGSSSVKYKLLDMDTNEELGTGGVEKIGMKGSFLKHIRRDGNQQGQQQNTAETQIGQAAFRDTVFARRNAIYAFAPGAFQWVNQRDRQGQRNTFRGSLNLE